MLFFSDRMKIIDEFHAWAQEANKKIKGGKIDERDPISLLAFLQEKGYLNTKQNNTETRENELHEPKKVMSVICSKCNRKVCEFYPSTPTEYGISLDYVPNYCQNCGARLKEIEK